MDIVKITRPPKDLVERVRQVGAATASATLAQYGTAELLHLRSGQPQPRKAGCGPGADAAVHAQARGPDRRSEYADAENQLHRHVLYQIQPGDMVVVDARGDMDPASSAR